jgi:hypothetical protein
MQRFQLPFEPEEFSECDGCMSTIYVDDIRELRNGKLICLDCLTAYEASYEFEMEEIEFETVRTKQCL